MVGAAVPFAVAVALSQSPIGFRWVDHFFTLIFLGIACGGIGVIINLPWTAHGRIEYGGRRRHRVRVSTAPPHFAFNAGGATNHGAQAQHGADRSRGHQDEAAAPPKRYAMSRREALRTLDVAFNAGDDDVREAYRRLAKETHPDHAAADGEEAVAEATRRFVRIREAYEVLIDEN